MGFSIPMIMVGNIFKFKEFKGYIVYFNVNFGNLVKFSYFSSKVNSFGEKKLITDMVFLEWKNFNQ